MKRLWLQIAGIVVGAVLIAMVINTIPGIIPVLFLGACWWAKPLPEFDFDAELRAFLDAT